jgi:hypothetical protein
MVAVVALLLLVVLANMHDEEGEKNWIIIPFFFKDKDIILLFQSKVTHTFNYNTFTISLRGFFLLMLYATLYINYSRLIYSFFVLVFPIFPYQLMFDILKNKHW